MHSPPLSTPSDPKSKPPLWRRLKSRLVPRVSLRLFFILLTLLCVGFGGFTIWRDRAERQRAACAELDELNWQVTYDNEDKASAKWPFWFRSLPQSLQKGKAFHYWFSVDTVSASREKLLEGFRVASRLPAIHKLELETESELSPELCQSIASIRNLKSLSLAGAFLDDSGVDRLSSLSQLEELDLSGTRASNRGIASLAKLHRLKTLNLRDTNLDDDGLVHLAGLTALESLDLGRTKVTSIGIAKLSSLRRLKSLTLDGTEIDDQIAATIKQFPHLENFDANDTALTDASCAAMLTQPSLQMISLARTDVGPQTITSLAKLPGLTELDISGVLLKPGEVRPLAAAKTLLGLNVPRDTPLDDLECFHEHPMLSNVLRGNWQFPFSVDSLKLIAGAPNSQNYLKLEHATLGIEGWGRLAAATNLEAIEITDCDLTVSALTELTKIATLQSLTIENCTITDASLLQIAKFQNLEILSLSGAQLTDQGLDSLASLTKLKQLKLFSSPGLTESSLAALTKLPSLEIAIAYDLDESTTSLSPTQVLLDHPAWAQQLSKIQWGSLQLEGAELDLYCNRPLNNDDRNLDLSAPFPLSTSQLKRIAEAAHLTHLSIHGPGFHDDQFALLGPLPMLEDVRLDQIPLGPNALQWLKSLPSLENLNLSQTHLTSEAAQALAATRVQWLHLGKTKLDDNALVSISQVPELTSLSLLECQSSVDALEQLSGATKLQSLEISHLPLTPALLDSLLRGLPALESLQLNHCGLTSQSLARLSANGAKLVHLNLGHNAIRIDDFRACIAEFPNLSSLAIAPETPEWPWDTEFQGPRLAWIRWNAERQRKSSTGPAPSRPTSNPSLAAYYFSDKVPSSMEVGNPWIDDELAIEMVRHNPKVARLSASRGAQGRGLLQELAKTDHINNLDLSYTQVTDADLPLLQKLTRLRHLNLAGCNISDVGVTSLAKHCRRLTSIDLSQTKISDHALLELAKLRFLESISVRDTKVTDDGLLSLTSLKNLAHLDIKDSKITPRAYENFRNSRRTTAIEDRYFP